MTKEVVKKDKSKPVVYTEGKFKGVSDNISAGDVQIPTLMLMQSNSTLAEDNKDINSGDFIHSITHDCWGNKSEDQVELVFFDMFKTQIISDVTGGKKKWIETKQWNDSMELDPYESDESGKTIRREKCFNYAVFRSLDIMEVSTDEGKKYIASPIIVKFKGGSLKNGKRLNQVFQDLARFGAPSWATTFFLTAKQEEKDGSKYWAYDFKKGKQAMKEQQLAAQDLCEELNKLRSNNALNIVDDEETSGDSEQIRDIKNYAEDIQV